MIIGLAHRNSRLCYSIEAYKVICTILPSSRYIRNPINMLWLYVVNLLVATLVSATWRDLKMYPKTDLYYKENDPGKVCPPLSCYYSGLSANELSYLRNKENRYRNEYAFNMRAPNLHMVDIVPGNTVLAQLKALQCLPPTSDTYLFDQKNVQLLYPSITNDEAKNVALEVVIVNRFKKQSSTTAANMKRDTLGHYSDLIIDDGALQWRGGITDMGCGYVLGRNDTHFIDFLVCIYSIVRMDKKEYTLNSGLPCTSCEYYTDVSYPNKTTTWTSFKCDKKFLYLCREKYHRYRILFTSLVVCSSPDKLHLPIGYFDKHPSDHAVWDISEEDKASMEEELYNQCSPIMLIISIVLTISIICLFLFVLFLFVKRPPKPQAGT